jgi:phosphopantetheine--protein transferase-like protein
MTISVGANSWLVCPQPDPHASLRLFLLPYAGAGTAFYRRWLSALPGGVEAWLVQLPGREQRIRERPFTRLEPLITILAPQLEPLLDRPFAFFGHSMGTIIAYELARELRRRGSPEPVQLLVSGRGAPDLKSGLGALHELPDDQLLAYLARLEGTPSAALANQELMQLVLPLLRADLALVETYPCRPEPPLRAAITAFAGAQDPVWSAERIQQWQRHTTGPFRLHLLEGNHFFLRTAEKELLERLRQILAPQSGSASTRPALATNEVHVWRVPLDQPPEYLQQLRDTLAPEEKQRALRFYFEKDRLHYVAGRGILRAVLAHYLACHPAELTFAYSPKGKPHLTGDTGDLGFNLSHSHGLALIALTRGRQIGVDLERIRPEFAGEQVAERFFSPVEVAALQALEPSERIGAFFTCWTRKEAYLKATGLGLSLPLDSFDVSLTPDEPALQATRHDPTAAQRWSLLHVEPGPGYIGAVAVEGHGCRLFCTDWPGQIVHTSPGK